MLRKKWVLFLFLVIGIIGLIGIRGIWINKKGNPWGRELTDKRLEPLRPPKPAIYTYPIKVFQEPKVGEPFEMEIEVLNTLDFPISLDNLIIKFPKQIRILEPAIEKISSWKYPDRYTREELEMHDVFRLLLPPDKVDAFHYKRFKMKVIVDEIIPQGLPYQIFFYIFSKDFSKHFYIFSKDSIPLHQLGGARISIFCNNDEGIVDCVRDNHMIKELLLFKYERKLYYFYPQWGEEKKHTEEVEKEYLKLREKHPMLPPFEVEDSPFLYACKDLRVSPGGPGLISDKYYENMEERYEKEKRIKEGILAYQNQKKEEYGLDTYESQPISYYPKGGTDSSVSLKKIIISYPRGANLDSPRYKTVMMNNEGIELLLKGEKTEGIDKIKKAVELFEKEKDNIIEDEKKRAEMLRYYGIEKSVTIPYPLTFPLYSNLAIAYALEGNQEKADYAFEKSIPPGDMEAFNNVFKKTKGRILSLRSSQEIEKELKEVEKKCEELSCKRFIVGGTRNLATPNLYTSEERKIVEEVIREKKKLAENRGWKLTPDDFTEEGEKKLKDMWGNFLEKRDTLQEDLKFAKIKEMLERKEKRKKDLEK